MYFFKKQTALLLFLICFNWGMGICLYAQEHSESDPAPQSQITLIDMIQKGGWVMYPLGFLSMAALALTFYNAVTIREKFFLKPSVIEELKPAMEALDIEQARRICTDNQSPVVNIVSAGLERIDGGELDMSAVEKAVEESSAEELADTFTLVHYLQVIASVAPMVGLLGTVLGMVKAFRSIATEGMGKPELLADNISEALITTASGLVVAIPALLAYFYFKNKYHKMLSQVSRLVGDLFHKLVHAAEKKVV